MHDPLDLVCQLLKGAAQLLDVWVPLGNVGTDACARFASAHARNLAAPWGRIGYGCPWSCGRHRENT
jgi:hypothetical protein